MKSDDRNDEKEVRDESGLAEIPEEEIERLKSELEAKAREAAENHDKYLRACADLENYKKRSEREKAEAIGFANETLVEEILPVVDNFERALIHANGGGEANSLREGVRLTLESLISVLKKFGLQEIKAEGERFNPTLHHAISEEESMDAEPGTVVREYQKGYMLKGRLLRAAMVAVSKKPEVH